MSLELKVLTMDGHVKTGLNGGTQGVGEFPDIIWYIAGVWGLSLSMGCEHANPRSSSLFASSTL